MKKEPKIWFHPIHGSGLLSVSWHPGPYGNAVYAKHENGVGWFAPNGEILSADFFDVEAKADRQVLEFNNPLKSRVEITVKNKKVTVKLISRKQLHTKAA